jgi:hypothetical protein
LGLWIEVARRSLPRSGEDVRASVIRTFQTEELFFAALASVARGSVAGWEQAARAADEVAGALRQGTPPDAAVDTMLVALPQTALLSLAVLQVEKECQAHACRAHVVECDAPPLFLVQDGQPVLLPVVEEIVLDRLIRRCEFSLCDGDYLAMVSEGFLQPRGWRWGWPDIAVAVRRWTDVGCDADELLGALLRTYQRLNPDPSQQDVTVVAMHVRPMRTTTIWTGPPADPAQDEAALRMLMAEQGQRVICGGTTAQIAARLLDTELETEPRPADGTGRSHPWEEVPPTSRLEGMSLVTEGLVTLRKARERMAQARGVHDLPRGEDGATRLAHVLLAADRVYFIVGLAANPQQVDGAGAPLRRGVVEDLARDLEARGKLVSVEHV